MFPLNAWFNSRIHTSVTVHQSTTQGCGLLASSSSRTSIPNTLLLAKQNIPTFPSLQLSAINWSLASDRMAIIIFLLYLSHPCDECLYKEWETYFDALPDVNTPVVWDKESKEYRLLCGTGLEESIDAKISKLEYEFNHLKRFLIEDASFTKDYEQSNPTSPEQSQIPSSHFLSKTTLSDFIWADFIFWSRVMSLESAGSERFKLAIVPFLDFANHSDTPNAHWICNSEGVELMVHDLEPSTLLDSAAVTEISVEALTSQKSLTTDINTPREIFISYGSKPNSELLFLHSFTLPSAPSPLSIPPPFISPEPYLSIQISLYKSLKLPSVITINAPSDSIIPEQLDVNDWNPSQGVLSDLHLSGTLLCVLLPSDPIELPKSLIEFRNVLQRHKFAPILFLRAFSIMSEALVHHLTLMQQNEDMNDGDENEGRNVEYVRILRAGMKDSMKEANGVMQELVKSYAEMNEVQKYLEEMQSNE